MKIDGRKQRGAATRALILATARAALTDLGADLTLDALAARVGLTKQAILHHFSSKERLFVELGLEVLRAEAEVAVAAVEGRTGADALERFVRALVGFYVADLDGFKAVYLRGQLLPEPLRWFPAEERRERLYPVTGRMYEAVASAVGASLRDGVDVRAVVVSAHMVAIGFATMYGLTAAAGDPMKRGLEEYLDPFLASWRTGLRSD